MTMTPTALLERTQHPFWASCGATWLHTRADGQLEVTDDFLRHQLSRPELAPLPASCAEERRLHHDLLEDPRQPVTAQRLAALADPDAGANYGVWLRFRERLLAHPTLEASYLALFQGQGVDVPPVLVEQITQVLLRHVLGPQAHPLEARAAEMLFRTQRITVLEDGTVMAADHETVERHALDGGFGTLGELLARNGAPLRSVDLDVLSEDNADHYWQRDEALDTAVCLNTQQPVMGALCRVLEQWVAHFLGVRVSIRTERQIDDEHWVWHVGLDAQASGVLNDLYLGQPVDEGRMKRLLCLFRLEFEQASDMLPEVAGRPVYLAMAMDEQQRLKLKPQNLLLNLPLARRS
jgi:hypothetical protein